MKKATILFGIIYCIFNISFPETASANTHPFLIVTESMYPELQARAAQSPWKEMKAEAISKAKSLSYPATGSNSEKTSSMRNIMNYSALAYILDPGNRAYYKNKIRDTLAYWSSLYPGLDHSQWVDTVYGGNAYFMSVLALDIIYNALTAAERSSAESVLGKAQYGWGWPHNRNSVPLIFALYKGDRASINSWKKKYREELFGPGGPIGKGQLTPDGAYTAGPTYAMSRLGAAGDRGASKAHIMDVLEFTREDQYYTDPTIRNFNRWLFTFGSNPFRGFTVFGDSGSVNGSPWRVARNYTLEKYSSENGALASWYLNGLLPESSLSLLVYITMDKPLPPPQKPTSHIFTDGGAAFWERNPSEQSLMGALLNMKNVEWHTHKEVNSIYLAGYGEHLLVNAGYTGPSTGAGNFTRQWIARNANSGNTVLINRQDHKLYSTYINMHGNGVTEGFTTSFFDYASGDSGEALPNGQHQRNFIFVHPQDGKNGYWTLFDEVTATNPGNSANVLLHPNSSRYSIITNNQEYQWNINGPFKRENKDTYITIFLGTAPSSVLLKDGVFAQFSDYLVNKYLDATFPTNTSGKANIATILFPHDATHTKAKMTRISNGGYSGVSLDHGNSIVDVALANASTGTVQHNGVSFSGQSALYRLVNNQISFYFVRQGTYFDDGAFIRRGFSAPAKVSLYLKNTQGKVISPGTNITFHYPGLTGITLNGKYLTGTNIYVPAGTHDITLVTNGSTSSVPTATTGTSAGITSTSVTLNATVNPHGLSATARFQYGTVSGNYTGNTANLTITGSSNNAVSVVLNGLSAATKYYYRVTATNSSGTSNGAEMSFTTLTASDASKPAGSITINNGATSTASPAVTLTLTASDSVGVTGYYISNSATAPSASSAGWVSITSAVSFTKSVSHTLPAGPGTRSVYAWYKNAAGNVSLTCSDSISLITATDTTIPTVTITSPASVSTYSTTQSALSLSGTASDNSGVTAVTCANNGASCGTVSGTTSWSISSVPLAMGKNNIAITAKDAANNTGTGTLTITRTTATASSNQWQQVPITTKALRYYLESKGITPAGGEGMQFVHYITYAPSNPNVAYLGVDTDTIWKSVDGGTTWQRKGKGINSNGIVSIAVDPNNENRVFVTGAQYHSFWNKTTNRSLMPLGIYRTLDGGENWTLVKQTFYGTMGGNWGGHQIDFAGANTIYAGTDEDGLLRSTDGGDTWTTVVNYASIGRIYAVKTHPLNNSIIYVGTSSGLKKVTSAGGISNIGKGLTGVVTVVLINPKNPLIMFAGDKSNRIMKSIDGGVTFTASFIHSNTTKDTAWMAMSPVDPDYVFVSFAQKTYPASEWPKDFYYTHNAAASSVTWQTAQSMDEKNQYGWVAGSLSVRFAGDNDSWSEFMGGPIAMHPTNKNIALYFAGPGVVKKTTDGGKNWRYSSAGYTAMAGTAFSLFSWDKNKVRGFATNNPDRGIYFSENGEHTFTSYNTPYHCEAGKSPCYESRSYGAAVGWGSTEDVIVGALGSHVEQIIMVSKNKGNTWTKISGTEGHYDSKLIAFSPTNSNVIYAGNWRSIDGGTTWTKISRNVDAIYWGNGDTVYSIGANSENVLIYKSTNRGDTWTSPYPAIPVSYGSVMHMAVSPTDPDKIYFGKRDAGVYIINGSATPIFKNENNGLLKDRWGTFSFQSIATDPNNDKVVYVGVYTSPRGHDDKTVFRSTDGGNSWENISYNLYASVNGIGVNPHDSYLYVGTWGGMWKLPPPGVSGGSPAVDTTSPVISITSPTSASTYASSQSTLDLGGTASDNTGVTSVTWTNGKGNGGTASGTTSWSISGIPLVSGSNHISVTARDAAGNSSVKSVTVTYTTAAERAVEITSPAPDSTLTDSPVNFEWSAGADGSVYWLYAGKSKGTKEYYNSGETRATRATISGLPWDGGRIYVRLWHKAGSQWQYNDYSYETKKPETIIRAAEITSPAPGSVLAGPTVNFEWSSISHVSACWLYVGKFRGTKEYYNSGETTAAKTTVSGLPQDGSSVYVRLWYKVGSKWLYRDYSYATNKTETAASTAEITSPAPGSAMAGSSVNFEWSAGSNVSVCWLYAGKSKGTREYYNSGETRAAKTTVSGLPQDGSAVYVRLWYKVTSGWKYYDYTYTAKR